jgi:hypothetical protein
MISNFSMAYAGGIEFEPGGPRRDSGPPRRPAEVKAWASKQALLVAQNKMSDFENYLAAMNMADLGGDPTPIATVLINRQPTALINVYDMLAEGKEIFAVLGASTGRGPAISMIQHWQHPHYGVGLNWNELDFSVVAPWCTWGRWLLQFDEHAIRPNGR